MNTSSNTPKFTLGCGDRFSRQGVAQLRAYTEAARLGVAVSPVWNKSHREHTTVHTEPVSVRVEADAAVAELEWNQPYYVDADHISLKTVDGFLESSDFFTLDVADYIGMPAVSEELEQFVSAMADRVGEVELPGLEEALCVTVSDICASAEKYLHAIQEAGKIYRHIKGQKDGEFAVEVSMDETDDPQSPVEMLLILAMISREGIPVDTIAPKFSGRFNKGVNYVGDVAQFEREFEQDVAVLGFAIQEFGMNKNLRLSVHSGSDKFSIYGPMNRVIQKFDAGLHVKTAGTTWLEEMIGLAEGGGDGLAVAKKIYVMALGRYDELAAPYATVIDIDRARLPSEEMIAAWNSDAFANALRHDPDCAEYNPDFRQLIHLAYKVAYELGDEYFDALNTYSELIARNVTHNLLNRHILPIFGGAQGTDL